MEDFLTSIDKFKKWNKASGRSKEETAKHLAGLAASTDLKINAFINMDGEEIAALSRSFESDADGMLLEGVPVGIKNNICIKDTLTTCASRILEGFRPPYNATVIEKLVQEGALLFPGLNMDEFAFGSSCETSCYGPTKNPWNTEYIPGGSSGGAAASVAAGEVVAALGSDTGGSIRQPASLCGVVGFKPTYGRVSRYGLIAFASSLDQIGPITRNVTDCAVMLNTISGYDIKDSTSVNLPVPDHTKSLSKDIKGLKIGIPKEYFTLGIDEDVKECVDEAVRVYKKLGAKIIDISLPHTKYAVSCYYIIGPAEASSNLARYDGVHYGHRTSQKGSIIDMYTETRNEGFGDEAKRRILLGTYVLSSGYYEAYYLKAQKVRTKIAEDFRVAFNECDCLLTPTSPTTAFKIGERINDPLKMYLSDVFTIPANLAGLPAVSLPCGAGKNNMPVGLQLMAQTFGEEVLIKAAHAFESNTEHHKRSALVDRG
ncbi:MAG: Asp-tRNA(Asn)/Glu-tRNA(Gln) amidotransferase subunit GatA [Candidatus Aadella gelida]|nr:Asp-tRNA(Asn)/Glu-tRNA(Gln) amidotransferase subunit GatA [Candidatus Aadella gelida]